MKRKSKEKQLINKDSDGEQWLLWSSGKHGQATGTPYHEKTNTENHRKKYTKDE